MKTILTIMLVLGLAGTGWAEGRETCSAAWYHGKLLCVEETYSQLNVTGNLRTDCEQRMEAAMRAMEDYTTVYPSGTAKWEHEAYRRPHVIGDMVKENRRREPELEKARKQWESVKRECWKKP